MKTEWWKKASVYQIYPRSFMDSNNDGYGDIQGIISKLDYLKDLGVDILWISPMYASPNCDNGYDISDYYNLQKIFGTLEDFDALVEKAHKLGLKIMIDLVFNHTSDKHKWFIESKKSKNNKYSDYYIWSKKTNDWVSCFSGSAWTYNEERDESYLHLFSSGQPDLNWSNPSVRLEAENICRFWAEKGVDGFRMDVISYIGKRDDLVKAKGRSFDAYTNHQKQTHEYLYELNEKVFSPFNMVTVGETPNVDVETAIQYTKEDNKELNMVFQFELAECSNDGEPKWFGRKPELSDFKDIMIKWQKGLETEGWNSLYWENHDQPRSISKFGNDSDEYHDVSVKMLAILQYMMKGTIFIYQGQELGMTNTVFNSLDDFDDIESINAYQDLLNRGLNKEAAFNALTRVSRDNGRTPFQWNSGENAGFTSGIPWLKVNPNYIKYNVEDETKDSNSVLNFYKKLLKFRKNDEVILFGKFKNIDCPNPLFIYEREKDGVVYRIIVNFSNREIYRAKEEGEVLLSNYESYGNFLKPYEALVIKK